MDLLWGALLEQTLKELCERSKPLINAYDATAAGQLLWMLQKRRKLLAQSYPWQDETILVFNNRLIADCEAMRHSISLVRLGQGAFAEWEVIARAATLYRDSGKLLEISRIYRTFSGSDG